MSKNAKTILCTLSRRPELTRKVLTALLECYGVSEYHVHLSVDFDERYPELSSRVIAQAMWLTNMLSGKNNRYPATYQVNNPRLGIDRHKLALFPVAFQKSNAVIHIEDDVMPARDFLRLMEWADQTYAGDPTVLSVQGYQRTGKEYQDDPANHYLVKASTNYTCWGWMTWRDRWNAVIGDESAYRAYAGDEVDGRFDFFWKEYCVAHHLRVIAPEIARIQNLVGFDEENRGQNWADPLSAVNYNQFGAWDMPNLPDPDPKLWRMV